MSKLALKNAQTNTKISLLELLQLLESNRNSIIINLEHLLLNYQRQSVKRLQGYRDETDNYYKPQLETECIDNSEYVRFNSFAVNRSHATINILIARRARLVTESNQPVNQVAGLLVQLDKFNNYTIVKDGKVTVESLRVKISSKKTFELLLEHGVLELDSQTEKFDFRIEYTIKLSNLPLVYIDPKYSNIDDLFPTIAEIKVLTSIIAAHLKQESDVFVREQIEELRAHYLSKNIYINFPTTKPYTDIESALANGTINSRITNKIEIGSKNILNLSKLHSANKFLNKMYQVYDLDTGEIFSKSSFGMVFNRNIAVREKQLSSRVKISPVDKFMKDIFDDYLGLQNHGIVTGLLSKVGAQLLVQLRQYPGTVDPQDRVRAMFEAIFLLQQYTQNIYQTRISPLVLHIGSTGIPPELGAIVMNSAQLTTKYPHLHLSRDEQQGTFYEVGESIISVYPHKQYYS